MNHEKLYDFVNPADSSCVLGEVKTTLPELFTSHHGHVFKQAFHDVKQLFSGHYPGYKASNTLYHDFEHTCSVTLATMRLIYGAISEGHTYSTSEITKGLLAALFHDVGLIQALDDDNGTGAKYTVGHEERSIQFMQANLEGCLSIEDIADIADCITCTILSQSPANIPFRTENMRMMGNFIGSADLLAQIADRHYIEKLLLLFEEFKEAKLPGYETPFELLHKTRNFYQDVARKRLDQELGNVDRFMTPYFVKRWDVERDFYAEAIHNNLDYLDRILKQCHDDLDCFMKRLRRRKSKPKSQC